MAKEQEDGGRRPSEFQHSNDKLFRRMLAGYTKPNSDGERSPIWVTWLGHKGGGSRMQFFDCEIGGKEYRGATRPIDPATLPDNLLLGERHWELFAEQAYIQKHGEIQPLPEDVKQQRRAASERINMKRAAMESSDAPEPKNRKPEYTNTVTETHDKATSTVEQYDAIQMDKNARSHEKGNSQRNELQKRTGKGSGEKEAEGFADPRKAKIHEALVAFNARISHPDAVADADGTIAREIKEVNDRANKTAEELRKAREELKALERSIEIRKALSTAYNASVPALEPRLADAVRDLDATKILLRTVLAKANSVLGDDAPNAERGDSANTGTEQPRTQSPMHIVQESDPESDDDDELAWMGLIDFETRPVKPEAAED